MKHYEDITEHYKEMLNSINLDFNSSLNNGYFNLELRHNKIVNEDFYSLVMTKTLSDLCAGIATGQIKIMEVNDNEE